jgi:preprotein translocase subunit SecG
VHLLVALAIIGLIMLQQGKGADMGASFGAGASQTLFGAWLVVLFFASSFGLALIASQKSVVVDDLGLDIPPAAVEAPAPAAVEEELPVLEEELPVLTEELPAAAPEQEDLPQLD